MVARWAHNPKVTGSSPVPATRRPGNKRSFRVFYCQYFFTMEYVVYILYSSLHRKVYTGFTSDLISRFHSHNQLATKGWTIKFRPWKVIYVEFYDNKKEAMVREKFFKSGKGREFIKNEILASN